MYSDPSCVVSIDKPIGDGDDGTPLEPQTPAPSGGLDSVFEDADYTDGPIGSIKRSAVPADMSAK